MTLAQLGYRSLEEVLGRSELLKANEAVKPFKVERVNLDYLLARATPLATYITSAETRPAEDQATCPEPSAYCDWRTPAPAPHVDPPGLNDLILADDAVQYAIQNHQAVLKSYPIKNTDRGVGARIGGTLAKLYGDHGFRGKIALRFEGSAGQSFGAFIVDNVRLALTGDANDYVGKGHERRRNCHKV